MPEQTQAPQAPPAPDPDIQERIDGFNKELMPLLGKYELGLAAMPRIGPQGQIVADPILLSVRKPKEGLSKVE